MNRDSDAAPSSPLDWEILFQALGHPVLVLDKAHTVLAANRAAGNAAGMAPGEMAGQKCWTFFHGADSGRPPEDCPMSKLLRSGRLETSDMILEALDGVWLVSCTPVLGPQGDLESIIHIATDVSDRRKAEKALRDSEERFRSVVHRLTDMIIVVDREVRVLWATPSVRETLGYAPEELAGRSGLELVHPDDLPAVTAAFTEVVRRENPFTPTEFRLRRADGSWVPVEALGDNLLDQQSVSGIVLTVRDITERLKAEEDRRRLEAQVQVSQKLESLGVLAGGIAHDFNNLLMGILGHAELALRDLSTASTGREHVAEIQKAAQRAADLCRQMLAYSGKGRFVVEHLDLSDEVEEMAHLLRLSISKRAVLKFDLSRDLPPVRADATQIRQVVMNLLTNASEALGDRSGTIAITTGVQDCERATLQSAISEQDLPPGAYVFLEVTDTGEGMDEETRSRIFDPFFSTKFTGRGLGLSAVLGIMRGHRGTVKVYSEPGRGTTFKVLFPAAEGVERPAAPLARNRAAAPVLAGTVLLVDDEHTIREVGARMLQRLGFSVVAARDGEEAVALFRERPGGFAVVLLDLTMPRMDGEECFRRLRTLDPGVPVILSSGFNEQEATQRFVGRGLAGFIQKPYTLALLEEKLRKVLA